MSERLWIHGDADHLLFGCPTFGSVWYILLQWLDISFVAPVTGRDYFLLFGNHAGLLRSSHLFLKIIWLAFVWLIWKEQNNRVFHHKTSYSYSIADKIKMLSFLWLKSNLITFVFSRNILCYVWVLGNNFLILSFYFIFVTCIIALET